jgi:hypothetical protein
MKNRCPALLILLAISFQVFGQTSESGAAKGLEGPRYFHSPWRTKAAQ